MKEKGARSADKASQQMIDKAAKQNIKLSWDRMDSMEPQCGFGELGICCRNCTMGPCRIDPFGDGAQVGICGADADTIVARNLLRNIAVGAAAHSDHGRDVAHTLLLVGEGKNHDYQIKDVPKLKKIAALYDIEVGDKSKEALATEVAKACLAEFGRQEGEIRFIQRAPKKRVELWRKLDIIPRSIDREVVESLHRTAIGVDNDYKNILLQGMRSSLADGWGGSMIATELQDIFFATPKPIRSKVNLGVLKEDMVNIVVHGHEPVLSEMAVKASQDPELIELAKKEGAKGINLAGICCTANEILMRHGVHVAGNFLQQELAIMTGAVEVMMVDVQCIMPSLKDVATCFHTELITTSPKAKFPGVKHVEFKEDGAYEIAKSIIKMAIDNFKNRKKENISIPKEEMDLVAGFSTENTFNILGGRFRGTFRPLNDGIISGRLRGVAGVVGCNNPHIKHDWAHLELVKELVRHDVLVLQTGCSAIACAKLGLLKPEAAYKYAGHGLKEICEAVGIPPVLHFGSCVDNSRILTAATEIVKEGGLGDDLSCVPAAGAAPEWMSEKAITIGFYFVASGVFTVFNPPQPVLGSKNVTDYICKGLKQVVGGNFAFEGDPKRMAKLMINHIDKKRKELNLKPAMHRAVGVKA